MDGYDQQTCCSRSGVKDDCLPMCQYNASLSQVRQLTNLCKDDLVKVTKCAAGMLKNCESEKISLFFSNTKVCNL